MTKQPRFVFLIVSIVFIYPIFLMGAKLEEPIIPPKLALERLKEGNSRFARGKSRFPRVDLGQRQKTYEHGQQPFATIIGCSDSRVPVELIFDQGIGDLFVIRVAGNVCDTDEVGSIEYGANHLTTPVVLVLGHRKCGAVTAVAQNAELHGSIPALVDNIVPAVERVRQKSPHLERDEANFITACVISNVWRSMEDLLGRSEGVKERVKRGKCLLVGAVYDLETGKVEWLGTHPRQNELLFGN